MTRNLRIAVVCGAACLGLFLCSLLCHVAYVPANSSFRVAISRGVARFDLPRNSPSASPNGAPVASRYRSASIVYGGTFHKGVERSYCVLIPGLDYGLGRSDASQVGS